jgi:hypothetical protein
VTDACEQKTDRLPLLSKIKDILTSERAYVRMLESPST